MPGAGSGWDAFEFALAGFETVAADLSATAVERCKDIVQRDDELRELADTRRLSVIQGDYFAMADDPAHRGAYQLIWDYTFSAALPPAMRPAWASASHKLLSRQPGSELVCLLFPVGKFEGGPPFAVDPNEYRALLESSGFQTTELSPLPLAQSHKARAGREWLGRFSLK